MSKKEKTSADMLDELFGSIANMEEVTQRASLLAGLVFIFSPEKYASKPDFVALAETDFKKFAGRIIIQCLERSRVRDLGELSVILAIVKGDDDISGKEEKDQQDRLEAIEALEEAIAELKEESTEEDEEGEVPTMPTPNPEEKSEE